MARASRISDDEVAAKRQTAAYMAKVDQLRRSNPDLSADEIDAQGLAANDEAVYGHDAKRDRHGRFIPQGIGSAGHESTNHFSSILRWQGKSAYDEAVAEIWRRDPARAERLRLPKPAKEKAA